MTEDWARPVVHWELQARDAEKQRDFYAQLCNWQVGDGPVMRFPPGVGGPAPGPGGHIRQGDHAGLSLYIQVRDLRASLDKAAQLGGKVLTQPADVPGGGPTIASIADPEGNRIVLVQQ